MRCSYFERCDPSVGWTCNMELAVFNFVVRKNLFEKLRKHFRPVPQNQMVLRCSRRNDNEPALLRLRAKVSIENTVDGVHGLRTATECEDSGINFRRIIAVREHNFVMHR